MQNTLIALILENSDFKKSVDLKNVTFATNEYLFKEGDVHDHLFLITEGKVRIKLHAHDEEGPNVHPGINDLGPDDLVGEFCLFDDEPASADVIAINDVSAIRIEMAALLKYLSDNPDIGQKIYYKLLQNYVHVIRRSNNSLLRLLTWGMKAHKLDQYL